MLLLIPSFIAPLLYRGFLGALIPLPPFPHHSASRFLREKEKKKGVPPSQASPFNGKIPHQKVKINVMSILYVAAGGLGPPASPLSR